jgi:hypothetical protein
MTVQLLFGMGVAFSFIAWAVVAKLYIWPQLRARSRIDALRPLLVLHAFRFIGLSFLVPGWCRPICRSPSHAMRSMATLSRRFWLWPPWPRCGAAWELR